MTRSKAILRDLSWHAVYVGSDTTAPASSPTRKLYVTPHLGLTVALLLREWPLRARGRTWRSRIKGRSRPDMIGVEVVLQERRDGGPWTSVRATSVRAGGRYEANGLTLARGHSLGLRWAFLGAFFFQRWQPAHSRTRTVVDSRAWTRRSFRFCTLRTRRALSPGTRGSALRRTAIGCSNQTLVTRLAPYSHSMVPGGLLVMSSTTRLTSESSPIIREAICSSRS